MKKKDDVILNVKGFYNDLDFRLKHQKVTALL